MWLIFKEIKQFVALSWLVVSMAINLFHSRRTSYALCKYWKRKTNGYGDANELIHNEKPSGYFYAKPMSAKNKDVETLQGVMMYDEDSLTLKTTDDIKDLKLSKTRAKIRCQQTEMHSCDIGLSIVV